MRGFADFVSGSFNVERDSTPKEALAKSSKPRKLTFKEKRELEALEAQIPKLEDEKSKVEYVLYNNPPEGFTELQTLSEKLATLSEQIDTSTERWLELSEIDA